MRSSAVRGRWGARLVGLPAAVALIAMLLSRTGSLSALAGWDLAWTAAAFGALAGTLLARASAAPANRRRWTLWAAACGCWLTGRLASNTFGIVGFPGSPNLATRPGGASPCWS